MNSISQDDLADIVAQTLEGGTQVSEAKSGFFTKEKYIQSFTSLPNKRRYVSEYDIRQMLKAGATSIRLPKNVILSPLALETLQTKGVQIQWE